MDKLSDLASKIAPHMPRQPRWIFPNDPQWVGTANAPLISTSWDGDARSTTAKTLIDLSAVFNVPAGVKAIFVGGAIRDSGSSTYDARFLLSPVNTADKGPLAITVDRSANDRFARFQGIVPCNVDGDCYYEVYASGAGTMDVWLEVWGYLL